MPTMLEPGDDPRTRTTVGLLVSIDVDDLDRAVATYAAAFGLRPGRRFGEVGAEMPGAPSRSTCWPSPPAAPLPRPRRGSVATTSALGRPCTWTSSSRTRRQPSAGPRRRARLEEEIRTHEWGRIAVVADPFGHGFCLIEFVGRGYDPTATG